MIELMMLPIVAGILGDSFGRLFTTIWDGISWLGSTIADFFQWLGGLIWDAIVWLGELLGDLFNVLLDLLLSFFELIYALIDGLLYFLYMIGVLAVKLFMIFFELAKIIFSFFVGLGNTLTSLSYTPQSSGGHGYSQMIGQIFNAMEPLQLNVVAYILLFIIWLFTAFQVIKLLSNIRVGGD
ncbi:hypothetical protein BKP45_05085 [Anaerobacillus alkalidiazotrophicus]|uniref:Uncharacterized protein n=1 Tax=Anaerobacillus alkalidiazotrophicus TaxID=472963 RepID=A0A1S2MC82_9BACI|nr:hypothetical protein [Anaerobacillus alkalidiazotrophicus]OIJ22053.1 hypothetical protein BKP45_05085 [Anaerobacillus alkalidiazotrophicus]